MRCVKFVCTRVSDFLFQLGGGESKHRDMAVESWIASLPPHWKSSAHTIRRSTEERWPDAQSRCFGH